MALIKPVIVAAQWQENDHIRVLLRPVYEALDLRFMWLSASSFFFFYLLVIISRTGLS